MKLIKKIVYFRTVLKKGSLHDNQEDKEVIENKGLLKEALVLYEELLSHLENNSFFDLFNLAESRLPEVDDKSWYMDHIQKPLRKLILKSKLVELESPDLDKKAIKDVWFPKKLYSKSIAQQLWQFTYDQFPEDVCKQEHIHHWSSLSWDGWNLLDYSEIIKDVEKSKSIDQLSKALGLDETQTFDWLNSFVKFLIKDESNLHFLDKHNLIPNQNGGLKSMNDRFGQSQIYIDEIKDEDLVEVLKLLGEDWKETLIHTKVGFGRFHVRKKEHLANQITKILKASPNQNEEYIKAIGLLSEWFDNNQEEGKKLFSELYRKRAELFMNTIHDKEGLYQIMKSGTDLSKLAKVANTLERNPNMMEDLGDLLHEFKADSISKLREILNAAQSSSNSSPRVELTQEILASLGVTSADELEEALKDKDIAGLFTHTSKPNFEMFLYAQSLIGRAKKNVIQHLCSLDAYDCNEMEELANTVIGGVKKNGNLVDIVIRPSDNGEVIVYYPSEKAVLDYGNAELWIDDGIVEPQHLTLGKILKTTGINRIPI